MPDKPILQQILRRAWRLLWNALILAAVFLAVHAFQTRNMLPASDVAAPALRGVLLRGGEYDSASTADRPTLVYFFAPWCRFCAASSDNLTRLRRWREAESLEIVTVVLDWQSLAEVRDYVERHDLDLPVVLGNRRIAQDWRVSAFPTYYVLGSDRLIRHRDVGYSTQLGLWWRSWFID